MVGRTILKSPCSCNTGSQPTYGIQREYASRKLRYGNEINSSQRSLELGTSRYSNFKLILKLFNGTYDLLANNKKSHWIQVSVTKLLRD